METYGCITFIVHFKAQIHLTEKYADCRTRHVCLTFSNNQTKMQKKVQFSNILATQ